MSSSNERVATGVRGMDFRGLLWTLGSLLVVTLVKLVGFEYVGPATPFLLYFISIIAASWTAGWTGGLLATVASAVVGTYFFLPPFHSLQITDLATAIRLGVFLCEGVAITWIVARRRSDSVKVRSAADEAKAALAKLRGVFDGVVDGITVQNDRGELVYANTAAAQLSGFATADEFLNVGALKTAQRFELLNEFGKPFPFGELPGRLALQGKPGAERLIQFRRLPSGETRWALVKANLAHLEGDGAAYAVNVFRDVTVSRQQEEAIRVHQEWLSTTLKSIGDAVIATDAKGTVMFMNPVAEQLTGWTTDESRGLGLAKVFAILNEQTRLSVPSPVEQVMREGKVVGLANHTILVAKDGKEVSIDDSAAPIRSSKGELVGTVLVFRDVSDRRDAERRTTFIARATAELASSLDYKQTLATVSRLAVPLIADWSAVDLFENAHLHRVAVNHVDPEKIRLVYDIQAEYPDDPNRQGGTYEILRTGKPLFYAEIPDELITAAARDERHLRLIRQLSLRSYIGVPLRANGQVIGVLTLAMAESGRNYNEKDLDLAIALADRATLAVSHARLFQEATEARAQAEQASRVKDEFLAMLGHELRNPLAPIVTALQLMKLRSSGQPDREQAILERQVKHVVALVDDLLDISRIRQGKLNQANEPVDLFHAITAALEAVSGAIQQRSHKVNVDLTRGLVVSGDGVRLTQVFTNLLANAAKYTPRNGEITIEAKRQDENIEVIIRDNGPGIPDHLRPKLFDLFVQGEQPIDRAQGGLGLGLAIVRSLVELHKGHVSVSSPPSGQGSEFRVVLPALPNVRAETSEPHLIEPPSAKPVRILLVDDNEDALDLLADAMRLLGYEVHTAGSAAAAIDAVRAFRPQVALLDIGLPEIDGFELARRLRSQPVSKDIRLVALTGYGQASDKAKTAAAGFDEHLVKPASLDHIQTVIETLTAPH